MALGLPSCMIVDIIAVLTESANPANYWRVYKKRLTDDGAEQTLAAIDQVPIRAKDHRLRQTDVATQETVLRLIQTIPSPRAEPFRVWLAQVGEERIEEIEHPERAVERIKASYCAKGSDEGWIEQRLRTHMTRNDSPSLRNPGRSIYLSHYLAQQPNVLEQLSISHCSVSIDVTKVRPSWKASATGTMVAPGCAASHAVASLLVLY